jgi:hypothetical protein
MYTPAVPVAQEWNGVVLAYLLLLVAAVSIYREEDFGLNALAGALLLLTIANIRNAWDLMLTITLATSSSPLIDELGSPDVAPLCSKIGRGARQSRTPRSQTIGLTQSEVLLGAARAGHVEGVVECSLQHLAEAFLRQMVHAG